MTCLIKTILVLTLFTVLGFAATAHAEIYYPWCARYGRNGGSNCGFSTYQQCRDTVSGIGGFCERNPFYVPPSQKSARHRTKQSNQIVPYSSGGGYSLFGTPGNPSD